jgi:hypothetical protein
MSEAVVPGRERRRTVATSARGRHLRDLDAVELEMRAEMRAGLLQLQARAPGTGRGRRRQLRPAHATPTITIKAAQVKRDERDRAGTSSNRHPRVNDGSRQARSV